MDAEGLTVIDTTDVLTGNTDLTCERETPTPDPVKHLPGHEHSDAIAMPWLTEGRAFFGFYAIAAAGFWLALS